MLFVELRFLFFFLVVFLVHWAMPSNTARKAWLLLVSHAFYACFFIWKPDLELADFFRLLAAGEWGKLPPGWWFPALLVGSTVWDYIVGVGIEDAPTERKKKLWVTSSIVMNLGVLAWFKYFNFFQANVFAVCSALGIDPFWTKFAVFLPYGISFYTFQSLSYSIEVYRGHLRAVRNFLDLAFFVAFFPQVVAGPIVRAMNFLPQCAVPRRWADVDVRAAVTLFFIGFVKKVCISENVAPLVDAVFANPDRYDLFATWMGVLFYAVQIYCDFSGYTDMAVACARLLGYELAVNFNFPYFAANITDFWRRWHISLSSWLRDYLYISLGGNRGSKWFTTRNLMLTMLLGGLWHGASWNFVIWGGLHGLALVVHKEWTTWRKRRNPDAVPAIWAKIAASVFCFYWVLITWVFFRATDVLDEKTGKLQRTGFEVARTILDSLIGFDSHGKTTFAGWSLVVLIALGALHWVNSRKLLSTWWRRLPAPAYAALLGIGFAVALCFKPTVYRAFIYFQF